MEKLQVRLLKPTHRAELDRCLRLYRRSFNADERVSPGVLRWVIQPSQARANPAHLFGAFLGKRLVGGACALVLPMFQAVFGCYLFVDPEFRRRGLGVKILREVIHQERKGPHGWNWRVYGEVTASSGDWWRELLARENFRFFKAVWPLGSYQAPDKVIPGRLCYFNLRKPPARFSQPALLAYVHSLFYGPEAMHRHLLPRLKHFAALEA